MIINIFENFTELKDIIVRYDRENSQGSIYKFCYQQAYEITMLLSLLLPLPKAPQGLKSSSVLNSLVMHWLKYQQKVNYYY